MGFPWRRLTLKIRFPTGYDFKAAHALVYIGESHNLHALETERAQKMLITTGNDVSMSIDNPLLNFRYLIYWKGPTNDELARAKQNLASAAAAA